MNSLKRKSGSSISIMTGLSLLVLCLIALAGMLVSRAWFSDEKDVTESMTAGRIIIGVNDDSVSQNLFSQSVLDGSISLVNDVTIELNADSQSAYGRIYMEFLGTDATAYTLNHDLTTYESSDYKWERIGQYYYLMNLDNTPKEMVVGTTYTFLEKAANTFSVIPTTGDTLDMNAKAVQSANTSPATAASLAALLGDNITGIKNIDLNVTGTGVITPIPSYTTAGSISFTVSATGVDETIKTMSVVNGSITSETGTETEKTYTVSLPGNISISIDVGVKPPVDIIIPEVPNIADLMTLVFNEDKTRFKIIYNSPSIDYSDVVYPDNAAAEFYFFTPLNTRIISTTDENLAADQIYALDQEERYDVSDYSILEIETAADFDNRQFWYDVPVGGVVVYPLFAVPTTNNTNDVYHIFANSILNLDDDWGSSYTQKNILLSSRINAIPNWKFGSVHEAGQIRSLTIPYSVRSLGEQMINWNDKLESIIIPPSVTSISYAAFNSCVNLSNVIIMEGCTVIGARQFSQSKISDITIPSTVTSIGAGAFLLCDLLTDMTVKSAIPPTLGADAIPSAVTTIRVPADNVNDYKTADGWSSYASMIVGY